MEQKGFQIGNYRITKTLGQGTFGKVKEGVHILTGQKVRQTTYTTILNFFQLLLTLTYILPGGY